MNASIASQNYAHLGVTLGILQRLRDGRTDAAYELLTGNWIRRSSVRQMLSGAYGFSAEAARLEVLQQASDYRAKFPSKHRYADVDTAVSDETGRSTEWRPRRSVWQFGSGGGAAIV